MTQSALRAFSNSMNLVREAIIGADGEEICTKKCKKKKNQHLVNVSTKI